MKQYQVEHLHPVGVRYSFLVPAFTVANGDTVTEYLKFEVHFVISRGGYRAFITSATVRQDAPRLYSETTEESAKLILLNFINNCWDNVSTNG